MLSPVCDMKRKGEYEGKTMVRPPGFEPGFPAVSYS
jgi:hypothetical protein